MDSYCPTCQAIHYQGQGCGRMNGPGMKQGFVQQPFMTRATSKPAAKTGSKPAAKTTAPKSAPKAAPKSAPKSAPKTTNASKQAPKSAPKKDWWECSIM